MDAKEALRLQKENNFVILDVRPEAESKEVSELLLEASYSNANVNVPLHILVAYFCLFHSLML